MNFEAVERTLFDLENQLLKPEVRESADKISEILDDDLIEFSASGNIYHYKKGDTFPTPHINWEIVDFSIKVLSDSIVLATFKLIKHTEQHIEKQYSIRSSLYKCTNGKWKMVFHQGTSTGAFMQSGAQ